MMTDTSVRDLPSLRRSISGAVIEPRDDDYDEVRAAYAATGTPALIVQPDSPEGVAAAIGFVRANGLAVDVRSGGHGIFGTNTDGLVIDLRRFDGIEVLGEPPGGRLVRLGSGATWGVVADALSGHGLALSSGDTRSVGVGGLTLRGGIGWMVRRHGLAFDSLVGAEIVTASGDIVHASEDEHADLFWAIRGGGGNFGVVTRFTFAAHPLAGIVAETINFGLDDLREVLTGWRDIVRTAPEELTTTFLAMPDFGEIPAGVQILCCYGGTEEDAAMAAIAPLLDLPGMRGHDVGPRAYPDILEDAMHPEGITLVGQNGFAPDLSDGLLDAAAAMYREMVGSVLMVRSLSGEFNRVHPDATAFAFRNSEALVISAAFLPEDAPDAAVQRIRDLWMPVMPHLRGAYGNFMDATGPDAIAALYPPATRARLTAVKHEYDPANVFRLNQNIAPG
jgi:FAD/FMN-containing dehydrogenase